MYRTIDTDTWDDPWFSELAPEAKLLFLYLVTNRRSNAAGCFEITEKAIAFETGLGIPSPSHTQGIPIHELMGMIAGRVTWWPEHRIVFIHNFYKHQSRGSNRENFRKGAMTALEEMPANVWCFVASVYPELTPDGGFPEVDVHHPITNPSPSHGDKEEVEVEVEVAEEVAVDVPPDKPARVASKSEPFEALMALCEATGADVGLLNERDKSKQLGKAKQLLAAGMTVESIGRCAGYLASQSWRTSTVDLFTVESERGRWELAGMPTMATEPPRNGSHAPPKTAAYHSDMAKLQTIIERGDTSEPIRDGQTRGHTPGLVAQN